MSALLGRGLLSAVPALAKFSFYNSNWPVSALLKTLRFNLIACTGSWNLMGGMKVHPTYLKALNLCCTSVVATRLAFFEPRLLGGVAPQIFYTPVP